MRRPYRRFKPLHCGAMLCCGRHARPGQGADDEVSNPFIAGQCSAERDDGRLRPEVAAVSNPFIAGQCSADLGRGGGGSAPRHVSNPFIAGQCSAVGLWFYDNDSDGKFQTPSLRGNALLVRRGRAHRGPGRVSNPFIAGQCSAGSRR